MTLVRQSKHIDFSQGPVWRCILAQAVPLTVAQLVQLLYNIVDRIYIGHMGDGSGIPLTGVGVTFPAVTLIMAFTALFGMGGVPIFSMARGSGENDRAGRILGNSFALLLCSAVTLTTLGLLFLRPILLLLGAGTDSYPYAAAYFRIYLLGTIFSMASTGLNGYINAQGFPRIGMLSVVIGAVINIILDPIFIFALDMGVQGAALATVISQGISALWILRFLTSDTADIPLKKEHIRISADITKDIFKLGTAGFIAQGTTFLAQAACNSTLQAFGGDLYVGIMTVANSVREIFMLPVNGIMNGAMPVISFNFGAKDYARTRSAMNFNALAGSLYTLVAWVLVLLFPTFWFKLFTDDPAMTASGIGMLRVYFFGFVFMALQFAGQSGFTALGDAKHAIFFSMLRKVVIVVPLTLLLPRMGFGVLGVFLAEPISNVLGGTASFLTMRMTVYKNMEKL